MDYEYLERSMTNIKPDENKIKRIEDLRVAFKAAGKILFEVCSDSRERSIAITKLEESLMWAIKCIVIEDV
jgi:hypothetical protein